MHDSTTHNKSITIEKRFWAKVDKRGPDDCWLWTASRRNKGYGAFCWSNEQGEQIQGRAHRFSYTLKFGQIPDGLSVLHRCDTPACVNPAHLFLGTISQNNADMVQKGRHVPGGTYGSGEYIRGAEHHAAKITPKIVVHMRKEYAAGNTSYSRLAKKYGLALGNTWRIVNRRSWKHVE